MGYTNFTVEKIQGLINTFKPKKVLDLGAQNMYNQPIIPAPYSSEWYKAQRIEYEAIDISGENGSFPMDLGKPCDPAFAPYIEKFDFVVDVGTSEHIGTDGKHDIEAFYNCWKTKNDLLKVGGIMVNENPKTGNWPGHGFQYYTQDFYLKLAELAGYEILELGEHAAMGNTTDGWNVFCVLKKTREGFVTLEEFKNLPIRLS